MSNGSFRYFLNVVFNTLEFKYIVFFLYMMGTHLFPPFRSVDWCPVSTPIHSSWIMNFLLTVTKIIFSSFLFRPFSSHGSVVSLVNTKVRRFYIRIQTHGSRIFFSLSQLSFSPKSRFPLVEETYRTDFKTKKI